MHWMHIVAAVCGFLLGRRYRAPAMLAASLAVALIGAGVSLADGAPPLSAVIAGATALATLQATYLATLAMPGCLKAIMRSRED